MFQSQESACEQAWTPLTDEEEEGIFRNMITGSVGSYLPWHFGNPDGSDKDNNVVLDFQAKAFLDVPGKSWAIVCPACDLQVSTMLSLIGSCSDSFFSKSKVNKDVCKSFYKQIPNMC